MLTEYRSGAFGTGNLVIIDAVGFFRAVGRINYAIFFVNSVTVIAGVFTYIDNVIAPTVNKFRERGFDFKCFTVGKISV